MDAEWDGIAVAEEIVVADGNARRPHRDSMFLAARLSIDPDGSGAEDAGEVRIRNLSERGLMAELDRPLDPGTTVALEFRGIGRVTGRVAWYAAGRIGVALDQEIVPSMARKPIVMRPGAPAPTGYTPKGIRRR